MAEKISYTVI